MVKFTTIYGTGKGKTTNALGFIYSQSLLNKDIVVVQFLKTGKNCGECTYFEKNENIEWFYCGKEEFFTIRSDKSEFKKLVKKGLQEVRDHLRNNCVDILLLDELGMVLFFKLARWKQIQELSEYVNEEIIITGRKIPPDIRNKSEKVICVKEKKHPYKQGVKARKGIDF
jgi:cob(I)alamin adenosyltransferase